MKTGPELAQLALMSGANGPASLEPRVEPQLSGPAHWRLAPERAAAGGS